MSTTSVLDDSGQEIFWRNRWHGAEEEEWLCKLEYSDIDGEPEWRLVAAGSVAFIEAAERLLEVREVRRGERWARVGPR